ncbi:MAG: hypothetical protein HPY75_12620 [Actinobacteria bacterium]|nr:hypothetical protein [Actinomycetota bacterium]
MRKKRKNLTKTAIAILLLVLGASMSMCCCGEHDSERYCETTIVAIKGKLREIYKESLDISDSLQNEDITGTQYLYEKDKLALEDLMESLEKVEDEIKSLSSNGGSIDDTLMLSEAKESLEMANNTAYSYMVLRDAALRSPDILTLLSQDNLDYMVQSRAWIDALTGREENPYSTRELYGSLFLRYLESASGNYLLEYYWIDSDFFGVSKDKLQGLINHYGDNLQRIRNEVAGLEVSEDLDALKERLLEIITIMEEQNDTLSDMPWPMEDENAIEEMDQEMEPLWDNFLDQMDEAGFSELRK